MVSPVWLLGLDSLVMTAHGSYKGKKAEKKNEEQLAMSTDPVEFLKTVPFYILFTSADGSKAKTEAILSDNLKASSNIPGVKLQKLRELAKLSQKYQFCFFGDGNLIPDEATLGSYVLSIKDNVTALRDAKTDNTVAVLSVYYRSRTAVDELMPLREIESSSTQPTEMTEREWNIVLLNNSLLHGLIFDVNSKTFTVAREPAFKLKRYEYGDWYRLPAGRLPVVKLFNNKSDSQDHDNTGVEKDDESDFLAPDFRVADDSSVTITEVKNSVNQSMTEHGFSSWSVEASAKGGFAGFEGGAKASGGQTSDDIKKEATSQTMEKMHTSYNFPRVEVLLDAGDLELSDSCNEFCNSQPIDVAGFYKRYGTIFSRSVVLGARLHSTVSTSTFVKDVENKTSEEKKASFELSFSSPFASAESGGSSVISSETTATGKIDNYAKTLNWEARGGETFLATDANAWINTIGFYQNWRVIERRNVGNIFDLALPMVDGTTTLITAFGGKKCEMTSESGTTISLSSIFNRPSPTKPGVTITFKDGYWGVKEEVSGGKVEESSDPQEWAVRLTSDPKSFCFCIPGDRNKPALAMDVTRYGELGYIILSPLDPQIPGQVWTLTTK